MFDFCRSALKQREGTPSSLHGAHQHIELRFILIFLPKDVGFNLSFLYDIFETLLLKGHVNHTGPRVISATQN
jgi:hypothetical protein